MTWGLPDFVFRSVVRSRGRGTRELGDVIVCVGDLGAVVQVKARQIVSDDPDKEGRWLDKKIETAASQARGTLRSLAAKDSDILINERDNRVTVTYSKKSWVPVVIIDHPGAEGCLPAVDAVVLWRRDWEFLFEQLKSTYAVIQYLHRVHKREPVPLGDEPIRYYQLAAEDAATPPTPLDLTGLAGNPVSASTPLLPQTPAGSDSHRHHAFLQQVLEDIAVSARPRDVEENEFLDVLAAVDTMPVGYRTELGRLLLGWLRRARQVPPGHIRWDVRRYLGADTPQLIFATASYFSANVQTAFGLLVRLRHQQLIEVHPHMRDDASIGILLTPRRDGLRAWDTTLCATFGEQGFTPQDRTDLEHLWPHPPSEDLTAAGVNESQAAVDRSAPA